MDGPDKADREHDKDNDEDETWRDLVSRLGGQDEDSGGQDSGVPPWPVQENLDSLSHGARVIRPADQSAAVEDPFAAQDADQSDDHYVPPPPPPLPPLDAIAKGAWFALFGGPGYLLVATVAGWTVPPWAAFCAVAAFVGGFVTLVLRMSEDGGDGSGPDDGAVV